MKLSSSSFLAVSRLLAAARSFRGMRVLLLLARVVMPAVSSLLAAMTNRLILACSQACGARYFLAVLSVKVIPN
jgi:hypothetical protein